MARGAFNASQTPFQAVALGGIPLLVGGRQLLYLLRKTVNVEAQHIQQFSRSTMTHGPTQLCLSVFPINFQFSSSHAAPPALPASALPMKKPRIPARPRLGRDTFPCVYHRHPRTM
jgi:hypothetical protein